MSGETQRDLWQTQIDLNWEQFDRLGEMVDPPEGVWSKLEADNDRLNKLIRQSLRSG